MNGLSCNAGRAGDIPELDALPFAGHAAGSGVGPVMAMRWSELLFAHWPVEAEALRAALPVAVRPYLDTFEGRAWLGVVPFWMSRVRGVLGGRALPAVPGLSSFLELNLRTYLNVDGVRGVWFFSLDAQHRIAVRMARWTFGLPYFDATMSCEPDGEGWTRYRSRRTHRGVLGAELDVRYRGVGEVFEAEAGGLASFLTSRYCLFTMKGGRLMRGDIWHGPWRLRPAEWRVERCAMTGLVGLPLPAVEPVLYAAEPLEVRAWWPAARGLSTEVSV